MRRVAILGASSKPGRYSFKAQQMLMDHGYPVYPVSRNGEEILGVPSVTSLAEFTDPIDTLTLYVGPVHLEPLIDDIVALAPRLVIFNPGTESSTAKQAFEAAGIKTLEACTLVLVSTNQFEKY